MVQYSFTSTETRRLVRTATSTLTQLLNYKKLEGWVCKDKDRRKLQALVYDILSSTTVVFSYAIWSRKLSANHQFFVAAQTVLSLLQTAQMISDVCFITDHIAYASSDKTKIV